MFDTKFFQRLAVHRQHQRDRAFFMTLCLLNGAIVFLTVIGLRLAVQQRPDVQDLAIAPTIIACVAVSGTIIAVGLAGSLAALLGRRAVQSTAVVIFYGYASLEPFIVIALALGAMLNAAMASARPGDWVIGSILGFLLSTAAVAIITTLLQRFRVLSWRPFHNTRRANA
jgi:hypothetical protein